VHFNQRHECIWAGTDQGHIYSIRSPTLEGYAFWRAHDSAVLGLIAQEDRCLSASAARICVHEVGGLSQLLIAAPEVGAEVAGAPSAGCRPRRPLGQRAGHAAAPAARAPSDA
jgi:hypothetical protein